MAAEGSARFRSKRVAKVLGGVWGLEVEFPKTEGQKKASQGRREEPQMQMPRVGVQKGLDKLVGVPGAGAAPPGSPSRRFSPETKSNLRTHGKWPPCKARGTSCFSGNVEEDRTPARAGGAPSLPLPGSLQPKNPLALRAGGRGALLPPFIGHGARSRSHRPPCPSGTLCSA